MRVIAAAFAVLAAASLGARPVAAQTAQTDQPPAFRSGVEVLEVDVTVVDGRGNPVTDLRGPEFSVTVDGQPRRVVSAEYIADVLPRNKRVAPKLDPYISNNTDRRPGRLIMIAVDRNNTDTNTIRGRSKGSAISSMSSHRKTDSVSRHFHLQGRWSISPPITNRCLSRSRASSAPMIRCPRDSTSATTRRW
jgi:hypothetical protein